MQAFTAARTTGTPDELWICEHESTYTQGLAGKSDHILAPGDIPVVQTNRGGQVTYHGPGQVVAYPLIDLQRAGYFVKEYVFRIEEAVIRTLAHFGVTGHRVRGAPGIYVRLSDPASHARLPAGFTSEQLESDPAIWIWARSPRWASRSAATAPTTAWRSMWRWTLNPSRASTPAATRA